MSFLIEEYSNLILTQLLYKTAVVLAILRWIISWALDHSTNIPPSSETTTCPSSEMIRDSLVLSSFGDVKERNRSDTDTCAVCLARLKEHDLVRELRNCCHVFHKECIDRWVDYELEHDSCDHVNNNNNHKSCPLCRAPLLTPSQTVNWVRNEPSWAVERILYLFGDDLLM
ncbi:hypothetical protein ACFE04_012691 [Oxalis oulophora]